MSSYVYDTTVNPSVITDTAVIPASSINMKAYTDELFAKADVQNVLQLTPTTCLGHLYYTLKFTLIVNLAKTDAATTWLRFYICAVDVAEGDTTTKITTATIHRTFSMV